MTTPRILIAGVGNIFLGDDAFGVEVVARLAGCNLPDGVCVVDFGIRGLDLAYAVLDGCDTLLLVDAMMRGSPPGTLYVIEPDEDERNITDLPPGGMSDVPYFVDMHGMDPAKVLRMARTLNAPVGRVLLVACEPESFADGATPPGLSEPVRAAVPEAVRLIESLVAEILAATNCTSAT
jgi:hydrogenase maturation protease